MLPSTSGKISSNTVYIPLKKQPKIPDFVELRGLPIRIVIPSITVDKEILPGIYDENSESWNVGGKSIHYAELSTPANNSGGNTLLYGHNNNNVFGKLSKLSINDQVVIYTDNNLILTYRFMEATDYNPQDTSIFTYMGPPQLTLQTCSGAFNQIRTLYSFSLVEAKKS